MRSTHCLPSYSFGGHDVFDAIPKFTKLYGKSVAIIGGETALSKALPHIRSVLDKAGIKVLDIIHFGGECTFALGKEIAQMASVKDADFLFAVGGGKAMDTVKVVAIELDDKPFFTIPTIASTCAATSEVAAVYTADHTFDDVAFVNHPPVHCFIDADILVEAPSRYLWAGMGDTIAKHYETHLSARNREQDYNTQLGLTLASMCSEPILAHGIQAYKDSQANKRSDAFDTIAMTVIFTTGVVSGCVPMAYNSNMAHAVCYGCVTNKETEENHLHGEIVAYGLLILLTVDQQMDELQRWLPVYRELGWPTKLSQLDLTASHIPQIVEKATSVHDIDVSPYKITADMLTKAIQYMESLD